MQPNATKDFVVNFTDALTQAKNTPGCCVCEEKVSLIRISD